MDIFGDATSIQTKFIAALALLFLFFVFLIMITWDRYGKEVSALYEARLESPSQPTDDDDFKAYKTLPTFFYEYAKKKKP
ncbi:hypothetical protein H257_04735 [Aphanomyces astaci]|uniref:Uncharacterized protein n=1 Tax=Aphanomyces astaci TaxID=112090 RepID=W4GUI6_APHAT|nr:hypothetical protein H257_04735 [Aphanomyces astaci]ETV82981.1 hypothetical protein H257_04735 [Aphanomyces astaci]|eukprot:XP_009827652.1 hypothetical protein H257_04735 [Aphanomyces astaci]